MKRRKDNTDDRTKQGQHKKSSTNMDQQKCPQAPAMRARNMKGRKDDTEDKTCE